MAIRTLFRRLFASEFARRTLLGFLIVALFLGGVQLRRWTWDETRHVRFQHDIVNGFYWGSETLAEARRFSPDEASANSWTAFVRGYFALYDRVKREAYEDDYRLDYPPLRLLVMSIWARQVRSDFPGVDDGHPKHVKPLLNVNLFCELLSAVAIAASLSSLFFLRHRERHAGAWVAGLTACAVFVVGAFDGGRFAWLQIGFLYGSEHYPYLFISSCYNLPSLLSNLGWSLKDPVWSADFGSLHFALTLQWTLRVLYLGALVLCAHSAARHTRNRDPRLLIAIAAPWLLMFALLGQMQERYLTWGAVISAVALAVNVRLTVLHFIISIASTAMIVHVMLIDKKLDPTLHAIDVLNGVRSYASVLVLASVAVCLWNMLSARIPVFQTRRAESSEPALSLGPAPEEV